MVLRISSLLIALAATPALFAAAGDVTCTYSDSETCPVDNFTPDTDDGSVLVYPGGNTRCAFDDYTDTKTTFSANSTYFFQVFPNENLDKSKVLLYFQGGGACTDKYTCNFGVECALGSSQLFTTVAKASSAGVLNRSMEANMFKDWNIIHIPYCTGDLHVGDRTTDPYTTGYEVALGNSQCLGQNQSMHMNGYNNAQSALQWALTNYPDPEHLIISGYSAGSLAAQLYSSYVANMWEVESKSIKYQVLADSYVGVFPEDQTPSSVLLDYFGACDVDLDFASDITSACQNETLKTVEMVSSLIEQLPNTDWLFIDSKADTTQRKFYELVKEGIAGYPFTNMISAEDFYSNMTAILDAYQTVSSDITVFNVENTMHVYTTRANFTEYVSDAGVVLGDLLNEWIGTDATPAPTTEAPTATPEATTATPEATTATPEATPRTPTPTAAPTTTPSLTTAAPTSTSTASPSATSAPSSTTTTAPGTSSPTTPAAVTSTPESTTATPSSSTATPTTPAACI